MVTGPLERRVAALTKAVRRPVMIAPTYGDAVALAERVGRAPDAWQAQVLRSEATQIALLCCRQSGKSTTSATLGLHTALTEPGAVVLVLSPGERQSKLMFKTMLKTYAAAGRPVPPVAENKLSLELANGSEIHALPGEEGTIRGFSDVALILVDEAARVDDALYEAVRPMLAVSGGRIVVMSTPFGRRGFFYQEWTEGGRTGCVSRSPRTTCRASPARGLTGNAPASVPGGSIRSTSASSKNPRIRRSPSPMSRPR